jgi:hypothetical protein
VAQVSSIGVMRRLAFRAIKLFLAYAALLLAVVVAGFLYGALGLWAAILWGCAVVFGVAIYVKKKMPASGAPSNDPQAGSPGTGS